MTSRISLPASAFFRYSYPVIILVLLLLAPLTLQSQTTPGGGVPIDRILNPDGTMNIPSGFNGSVDTRGWRMLSTPDGKPRFLKTSAADPLTENKYWDDRFGASGVNGYIRTIAVKDDFVYVGGQFSIVGGILANNIARWHIPTNTWYPLGTQTVNGVAGLSHDSTSVNAIVVDGNDLVVGGIFESAGSEAALGIARYHIMDSSWTAIGNGLRTWYSYAKVIRRGGEVNSIIVKGSTIYAGGVFSEIEGTVASASVVKWNGLQWVALGGSEDDTVRALGLDGNTLYAGYARKTDALLKYDGSSWASAGSINGSVYAIAPAPNGLYIGGSFASAGGQSVQNLAVLNTAAGTFAPVGAGVNGIVFGIHVSGNDMYIGGAFNAVGNLTANGAARWNGAAWSALANGVGDTGTPVVYAFGVGSNGVYVGGKFLTAGIQTTRSLARFSGTQWYSLYKDYIPSLNKNGADGAVFVAAVVGRYVYVGGDFTNVGGQPASYVARWDMLSSQWQSLGAGIGGSSPFIRALAVDGDNIYFGGSFESAGGVQTKGIAVWNQTSNSWSAVSGGVDGQNPYVFGITVSGSTVYAVGAFTTAGGVPANRIAKYSSGTWSALGSGLEGVNATTYAYATAVAVIGSNVYAAGEFSKAGGAAADRIARWDGSSWSTLGTGVNGQVSALAVEGTNLYVGGEFTNAGGSPISYFARWDGSAWNTVSNGPNAPVSCIIVRSASEIYVGGTFVNAGSVVVNHITKWNGTTWSPITFGTNGAVRCIALNGNEIYVGGGFTTAGNLRANNIALFDGASWTALGSDTYTGLSGIVYSMTLAGNDVYVGGLFESVGGLRSGGIAKWDGTKWSRLGAGLDGLVRSISFAQDGSLYVGGDFSLAGTISAKGVARWDGTNWNALGNGIDGGTVYTVAAYGDSLLVGGSFTTAGGTPANHLAVWNQRTQTWSPFAGGVGGSSFITLVKVISVIGKNVYVGGLFPTIGNGVYANNIAKWDGTSWSPLGEGISGGINTITSDRTGKIIVGGQFKVAGNVTVNNVAGWDGSVWSAFGLGLNGTVYAAGSSPQGLFVGGDFITSGNTVVRGIAYWADNSHWVSVGTGVAGNHTTGVVYALAATRDSGLYIGGDFAIAGDKASFYFGRWFNPTLSVHDDTRFVGTGSSAGTLSLRVAPNPIRDIAHLSWKPVTRGEATVTVSDPVGRVVLSTVVPAERQVFDWNTVGVSAGTYVIRVTVQGHAAILPVTVLQ